MRRRLLTTVWLRRMASIGKVGVALVLLIEVYGVANPAVLAAPRTHASTAAPQIWYWPTEAPQYFCDIIDGNCFEVDGSYGYNCGCPPNTFYEQSMGVTIRGGAVFGQQADTNVKEYVNGNYVTTFYIQSRNCIDRGYPDSSICGENSDQVDFTRQTDFEHYWYAIDPEGFGSNGDWLV